MKILRVWSDGTEHVELDEDNHPHRMSVRFGDLDAPRIAKSVQTASGLAAPDIYEFSFHMTDLNTNAEDMTMLTPLFDGLASRLSNVRFLDLGHVVTRTVHHPVYRLLRIPSLERVVVKGSAITAKPIARALTDHLNIREIKFVHVGGSIKKITSEFVNAFQTMPRLAFVDLSTRTHQARAMRSFEVAPLLQATVFLDRSPITLSLRGRNLNVATLLPFMGSHTRLFAPPPLIHEELVARVLEAMRARAFMVGHALRGPSPLSKFGGKDGDRRIARRVVEWLIQW